MARILRALKLHPLTRLAPLGDLSPLRGARFQVRPPFPLGTCRVPTRVALARAEVHNLSLVAGKPL